jgi:hypothetical protein
VDVNDFEVFQIDQRSHLGLLDASRRLVEMERSG